MRNFLKTIALLYTLILVTVSTANAVDVNQFLKDCHDGNKTAVEEALKKDKKLANAKDEYGTTALMYTIQSRYGNKDIVELLIESGADVNAKGKYGETAITIATTVATQCARDIDNDIIKFLINNGADVNVKDQFGETLLTLWTRFPRNMDTGKILIKNGVDINAKNIYGDTALIIASKSGYNYIEIVELLINNGADINIKNNDGNTALEVTFDTEIKELLNGGSNRSTYENLSRYFMSDLSEHFAKSHIPFRIEDTFEISKYTFQIVDALNEESQWYYLVKRHGGLEREKAIYLKIDTPLEDLNYYDTGYIVQAMKVKYEGEKRNYTKRARTFPEKVETYVFKILDTWRE